MPFEYSIISDFFLPDGALAQSSPSYIYRDAQLHMANFIAEGIRQEKKSIVIEASTGTGKTFAYLAAAMLAKKRTIVSTATKTLQDQLFKKDLPVILRAIERQQNRKISALILKGRSNYVCLKKIDEKAYQDELFSGERKSDFQDVLKWVKTTDTGDFSELSHLPENSPLFAEFDARAEHCINRSCTFYNDCFVTRQRRQAQNVDLIIVNHALMCTDGAIRAKSGQNEHEEPSESSTQITAQILPDFDLWIIDEAHAFADSATKNFGIALSEADLRLLVNDVLYIAAFLSKKSRDSLSVVARGLLLHFCVFIDTLLIGSSSRPMKFSEGLLEEQRDSYEDVREALRMIDIGLIQAIQTEIDYASELKILSRRVHDLSVQLNYVVEGAAQKSGYLVVAEKDTRGASLCAWPINPGRILRTHLWELEIPVVMTSATLAFNKSTKSFRKQIGLEDPNDENTELLLDPIFDYQNRSALYVAQHLPNPNEAEFTQRCIEEIRFLVSLSEGGALVLFTSHRALSEVYSSLCNEFSALGYLVLRQGDAPKLSLLEKFASGDRNGGAVLFATHSFWEGVDIPGRALRMVIVDRLPFHSINEPLFEARMSECQQKGGMPFQELALPDAALTLKQGIGRLLRKHDDAGVAAVLDSRLLSKSYGRQILKTLGSMNVISSRKDIEKIWRAHISQLLGT